MGLALALAAHRSGNTEEAAKQYRRALDQGAVEAVLFQNYGALLRKNGDEKSALKVYSTLR